MPVAGTVGVMPLPRSPAWTLAVAARPFSVVIEDEVLLLDPRTWAPVTRTEDARRRLPGPLAVAVTPTRHGTLRLRTGFHATVGDAAQELASLRTRLSAALHRHRLRGAVTGVHPLARGSAPTSTLRVSVALESPEVAVRVLGRLRPHLPLLLALSANSPFHLGRDTGWSSARAGVVCDVQLPERFRDFAAYAAAGDAPASSVRLRPDDGTIEVAIMDGQTRVRETGALAALVHCLILLAATDRLVPILSIGGDDALEADRGAAARAGMRATLVHPLRGEPARAREIAADVAQACAPAAAALGCRDALDVVAELAAFPGDARQRSLAGLRRSATWGGRRLVRVLRVLSEELARDPAAEPRPPGETWGMPVGAPSASGAPRRRRALRRFGRSP